MTIAYSRQTLLHRQITILGLSDFSIVPYYITHNRSCPNISNKKSMKYAGRKWKKMKQKLCTILLLRILPSGYQIVISNGFSYTALRPLPSTSFHVTCLTLGAVTLNTGISLDLQQTQPKLERDHLRAGVCRQPKHSYH